MAQPRTTGLWARVKGLFTGRPFEQGEWRAAKPGELIAMGSSPTSRQYVRVGEGDFSPLTRRLSRTKYIELSQGAPPVKLARERKEAAARGERVKYPSGERGRLSAGATTRSATQKRLYSGETLKDIGRFKELQDKKRRGEWLSQEDFDWMMEFASQHAQTEHKFLHENFGYPPSRRKLEPGQRQAIKIARARKASRLRQNGPSVRTGRGH